MQNKVLNKNNIKFLLLTFSFLLISLKITPISSEENKEILLPESISKIDDQSINESPYIIGPGDVIGIDILDAENLNEVNVVLNDGTLSVPVVGNLKVSGLSVSQAKTLIEKELNKELIKPNVRIIVKEPRQLRIAVLGEVQYPGIFTISSSDQTTVRGRMNNIQNTPTVIEAIQKSGGITKLADLTDIEIIRKMPGNNGFKKAKLNLLEAILEGKHDQNPFIFDQDTIYVPKANMSISQKSNLAATNLSPAVIDVYILGEVNKPGLTTVSSKTPLIQGIMAAGGPKYWRGNTGSVELVRLNRDGTINNKKIKINLKQNASSKFNPLLKQGDIVRVNRTQIAKASDAITEVTKPFTGILNAVSIYRFFQN